MSATEWEPPPNFPGWRMERPMPVTLRAADDGTFQVEWDKGQRETVVSRELLDLLVGELNLRVQKQQTVAECDHRYLLRDVCTRCGEVKPA